MKKDFVNSVTSFYVIGNLSEKKIFNVKFQGKDL